MRGLNRKGNNLTIEHINAQSLMGSLDEIKLLLMKVILTFCALVNRGFYLVFQIILLIYMAIKSFGVILDVAGVHVFM